MTVIDTSGVVDFLLADGAVEEVEALLESETTLAAPDLLVFEVLAVLRRDVLRGAIADQRAQGAIEDLGDLTVDLYPSMLVRERAWELRENLTAGDALFVALAERLGEPLATKDRALAAAARRHTRVAVADLR